MTYVNSGITNVRDYFRGNSTTSPTHIAIGDDSTDPTKQDTTLTSELTRLAIDTINYTSNKVIYTAVLSSTEQNGEELKEAGLFNASVAGTMFDRFTHTTISKNSNIEVEYVITLTFVN